VTVPSGKTSVTFAVNHMMVGVSQTVTITATSDGVSQTTTLTVDPLVLVSISLNPSVVKGGSSSKVTGTVTLNAPVGSATSVSLSSSSGFATVPAKVVIPVGKSTVTFSVTHKKVTSETSVTITATLNAASKTATLDLTPG